MPEIEIGGVIEAGKLKLTDGQWELWKRALKGRDGIGVSKKEQQLGEFVTRQHVNMVYVQKGRNANDKGVNFAIARGILAKIEYDGNGRIPLYKLSPEEIEYLGIITKF